MRLSGSVLNASRPSMMLPAVLFPDPERPSSTSRSSEASEADEAAGKSEEEEAEVADVGEEVKEEETRDWEAAATDTSEDPSFVPLNCCWSEEVKFAREYSAKFLIVIGICYFLDLRVALLFGDRFTSGVCAAPPTEKYKKQLFFVLVVDCPEQK